MKQNKSDLEFGLRTEIPNDAPAGYGVRCIQEDNRLGFVWNRQDMFAIDEGHAEALKTVLNKTGITELIADNYRNAYHRDELRGNKRNTVILFEDDVLVVKADTLGSHGYVYLCAYLKPSDNPSEATWSGKGPVPEVGETIFHNCNNIGKSIVLRHHNIHGFVHLWCWPINPPAWYKKQNKQGTNGWRVCTCVGSECMNAVAQG